MKKRGMQTLSFHALIFISLCLCAFFSGCKASVPGDSTSNPSSLSTNDNQLPVITICVDMMAASDNNIRETLSTLPGYKTEYDAQIELIPTEDEKRNSALGRIRTELLSGKGPDIFFFDCYPPGLHDEDSWGRLFPFVEKLMENRTFLPLDDLIDNPKYMVWDELLPCVMNAGKNEEGQLVLPLGYTFSAHLYSMEHEQLLPSQNLSWDNMRTSDNPLLFDAAGGRFSDIIGNLADYPNDTLCFTEEDLLSKSLEMMDFVQSSSNKNEGLAIDSTYIYFNGHYISATGITLDDDSPGYLMVPGYNCSGGLTVNIASVAAVNRNTEHADIAISMLDYLLSKESQQKSPLFTECVQGMPVCTKLGDKNNPLQGGWYMNNANFQAYNSLLEKIDTVKFFSPLDNEMMEIVKAMPCSEDELKKVVHKQFMTMQMMLAES